MLAKRIIPCLDVRDGKVTKGVQFLANIDVGDPVAMARYYYEQGADEIVFYDIIASNERRGIMLDVVRSVAPEIFIPFSVGGEIRPLAPLHAVLPPRRDKLITRRISAAVSIPVIASGGAGEPTHLRDAFTTGLADAAIVASIVHYGEHPIPALKSYLKANGVEIRDAVAIDLEAR